MPILLSFEATAAEATKRYVVQGAINHFQLAYGNLPVELMVTRTLLEMMTKGANRLFAEIYSIGKPVVIDWHIEEFLDPSRDRTMFKLHYRLMVIQSHNVFVPSFEFVTTSGKKMWKCTFCRMVNVDEATYCGEKHEHAVGCGHPRDDK